MKLSNVLVAAAMMVGSVGALGCSTNAVSTTVDEVAQAASEPGEASSFLVGFRERFSFGPRYHHARPAYTRSAYSVRYGYSPVFVRFAPPSARYESFGRAPSGRHFWVNGYQRWTGNGYSWIGGHWDIKQNGRTWVQPHYDIMNGRHVFIGGHWG